MVDVINARDIIFTEIAADLHLPSRSDDYGFPMQSGACQRAAESPHFGARNFPQVAGLAINRLRDQGLRFWAVDRGA
jgi:hypothetical protein